MPVHDWNGREKMKYSNIVNVRKIIFCIILFVSTSISHSALSEDSCEIIVKLIWTAQAGIYSDVNLDLYVTEPNGEVASPLNPSTILGGELTASDTSPEIYEMETGAPGDYTIAVKYPAYDTEYPQEASLIVLLYGDTIINFGPETLGRTVGPTWHAGEFNFPSGAIIPEGDGGSGCFIATAAYGTPLAPQIQSLRTFRDKFLINNFIGKSFIRMYCRVSPPIARIIEKHPFLRYIIRKQLAPVVFLCKIITNDSFL